MITKQELQRVAKQKGIADLAFMEKDYAITWALKAIYSNPILEKALVFKGGTCISKIYAENYRLSADLDFSIHKGIKLNAQEFEQELAKAFEQAKSEGGPELKLKDRHSNPGYITFQIQYTAILEQSARLKLDISLNEKVICAANSLALKEKTYSDINEFKIHCYALQEIAVEKMRALFQRGKSRDYYDLWRLMTEPNLKKQVMLDVSDLRPFLEEKCLTNGVPYEPELMFDDKQLQDAKDHWKDSLGRMVAELPDFEKIIAELKEIFFEENELTKFSKDFSTEHLDDINRGAKTNSLLNRAVELLFSKLESKRKSEVLKALNALQSLYCSKDRTLKFNIHPILSLANDKDKDIRTAVMKFEESIRKKQLT